MQCAPAKHGPIVWRIMRFIDPFPTKVGCNWAKMRAYYNMRRENETVTMFTIRVIRNEIFEEAAKIAEARVDADAKDIAQRIRKAKDEDRPSSDEWVNDGHMG